MLSEDGFNRWSATYDASVAESEEEDRYPFAGYGKVLAYVYQEIMAGAKGEPLRVLDIGFGTAVLTGRLYDAGCEITGVDFSEKMQRIAREKMPRARLFHGDFSRGLPEAVRGEKYDYIISTYALHHLADPAKRELIGELLACCRSGGAVLIGDVAFADRERLNQCRAGSGDEWDDEECYFVAEDWQGAFPDVRFRSLSSCAGVLVFPKEGGGREPEQ